MIGIPVNSAILYYAAIFKTNRFSKARDSISFLKDGIPPMTQKQQDHGKIYSCFNEEYTKHKKSV
jgi:hypothetical protein